MCTGKTTTEGDACVCDPLDDCHTCTLGNDTETGELLGLQCVTCKNGRFLLGGVCRETCPAGYEPEGAGNFNRRCVSTASSTTPSTGTTLAPPTICDPRTSACSCPANCTTCTTGTHPLCLTCEPFFFFLEGACLPSCPEGYEPAGMSPADQSCVQVSTQLCDDAEQVQVTFDELDFALLQSPGDRGAFVDSFLAALLGEGVDTSQLCDTSLLSGSVVVTIIVPDDLLDALRAAIDTGRVNATLGGTVATARIVPSSSVSADMCIAKQTSQGERCLCNPLNDCHECILDQNTDGTYQGSICTKCKNAAYLHNGECIQQCPNGTIPDGLGNFNLRCSPIVEEPSWRLVSPETRVVFSNAPSVLRPQIVIGRTANTLGVRLRAGTNGQVFFMSDTVGTAYMSLSLRNGAVRLVVNLGFGETAMSTATSLAVSFVDNQWHDIRVTRAGTALALSVDDHPVVHGSVAAPFAHVAQFGPLAVLGKANQAPGTASFTGCISSVMLDEVPLTLAQAQAIFDVADCDLDGCSAGPCQNGATCVPATEGYYCLCAAGFKGFTCDTPENICASLLPCHNGGVCRMASDSGSPDNEDFVCDCPLPFTGRLCDTEIDFDSPFAVGEGGTAGVRELSLMRDVAVNVRLGIETTTLLSLQNAVGTFDVRTQQGVASARLTLPGGSMPITFQRSDRVFAADEWLNLHIQVQTTVIAVTLDDTVVGMAPLTSQLANVLTNTTLRIAVPSGCSSMLRVDGAPLTDFGTAFASGVEMCNASACNPSPCMNDALGCMRLGDLDFACQCAPGFSGPRCEVQAPYALCDEGLQFGAGRLLLLNPDTLERTRVLPDKPLSMRLSFRYDDAGASAVLFSITSADNTGQQQHNFGTLRMLSTGQVAFTTDYGGTSCTALAPMTFDDGEWHTASIVRTMQEASLVLDDGAAVAHAVGSVTSSDEWESLFQEPRVGTLLGSDVGPPLRGVSQAVCARRCIDEEECLSFDYTPARVAATIIQPSSCSLNHEIVARALGGLSPSEDTLHYELRSATDVAAVTVTAGRSDDALALEGSGGDPMGSGDMCDVCLGGFVVNDAPADLASLSGQSLTPCAN